MSQGFSDLSEKAHIFNCDDRLIGKCPYQLNLAVSKKSRLPPGHKYRSDDLHVTNYWHSKTATKSAYARNVLFWIKRIVEHIRNMTNGAGPYRTRSDGLIVAALRIECTADCFNAFLCRSP